MNYFNTKPNEDQLVSKMIKSTLKVYSVLDTTLNYNIHSMKKCIIDFKREKLSEKEKKCFLENMRKLYNLTTTAF